jgi:hypothetical protein
MQFLYFCSFTEFLNVLALAFEEDESVAARGGDADADAFPLPRRQVFSLVCPRRCYKF